jgi:hypothetical protein
MRAAACICAKSKFSVADWLFHVGAKDDPPFVSLFI